MENPIKMGDFGGTTIFGNIHMLFDLFWSYTPLFPIEFHRNVTWPHHEASKFDKTTPLDFTQFQVGESLYFQPIAWPRHIHKDYRKKEDVIDLLFKSLVTDWHANTYEYVLWAARTR